MDGIRTKAANNKYRNGWERTYSKKKDEKKPKKTKDADAWKLFEQRERAQ